MDGIQVQDLEETTSLNGDEFIHIVDSLGVNYKLPIGSTLASSGFDPIIGRIDLFAGTPTSNWLPCDGSSYPISTSFDLYILLDGFSGSFNTPNLADPVAGVSYYILASY